MSTDIDTGGMQNTIGAQANIANSAWEQGMFRNRNYYKPVMNELMRMMGFGGSQYGGGAYSSPLYSRMMGLPTQTAKASATAQKSNLMDMSQIGPIQKGMLSQDTDRATTANLAQNAQQYIMQALNAALSNKGDLFQGMQIAQSGYGQIGQMQGMLAQMQMQAQQQQNMGLYAGLQGIGSIAGMLLGGAMGGPFGAAMGGSMGSMLGGGAAGGGAPNLVGVSNAYGPQLMGM